MAPAEEKETVKLGGAVNNSATFLNFPECAAPQMWKGGAKMAKIMPSGQELFKIWRNGTIEVLAFPGCL
jgi:hypothetical protein